MLKFIILITLMPLLANSQRDFPQSEDYGPITRPTNPTKARDVLGYDTFQKTSKNFNNVQYGNHWEDFDTPELKYNPEFRPVGNTFKKEPYVHNPRDKNFDFGREPYRDFRRNY